MAAPVGPGGSWFKPVIGRPFGIRPVQIHRTGVPGLSGAYVTTDDTGARHAGKVDGR
jgi:hypothetical protein